MSELTPAEAEQLLAALGSGDSDAALALARELVTREVAEIELAVPIADKAARTALERAGFVEHHVLAHASPHALVAHLERPEGTSYGAIYVQTDDETPLRRALARFVPRLPDVHIADPHNGWLEITDAQLDADPKLLRRLGRELSVVAAAVVFILSVEDGAVVRYALLERGSLIDEYLSIPEFHGPLPPGEVVALGANPTAVARLTGAEAARVRATCRTATAPAQLPPADELYREIAAIVGVTAG